MSLENEIQHLAAVLSFAPGNAAIAEIIRQRDQALVESARYKANADYWTNLCNEYVGKTVELNRKISALRGVITRLKNRNNTLVRF